MSDYYAKVQETAAMAVKNALARPPDVASPVLGSGLGEFTKALNEA
jgi:hypothetical protein